MLSGYTKARSHCEASIEKDKNLSTKHILKIASACVNAKLQTLGLFRMINHSVVMQSSSREAIASGQIKCQSKVPIANAKAKYQCEMPERGSNCKMPIAICQSNVSMRNARAKFQLQCVKTTYQCETPGFNCKLPIANCQSKAKAPMRNARGRFQLHCKMSNAKRQFQNAKAK